MTLQHENCVNHFHAEIILARESNPSTESSISEE